MKKLTQFQAATMESLCSCIDAAREIPKEQIKNQHLIDEQNGIVYSPGGLCKIGTLKGLEERGMIEILEDNTGIGTGVGAFPSKVKVLCYLPPEHEERIKWKEAAAKQLQPKPPKPKVQNQETEVYWYDYAEEICSEATGEYPRKTFKVICNDDGSIATDLKLLKLLYVFRFQARFPVMITDRALIGMATFYPQSREEFINLAGCKEKVYAKCGEKFISLIDEYLKQEGTRADSN